MKRQSGTNGKDLKLANRLLVLKLIATGEASSRVELAKITGLTKMTVGNIIANLMEAGIIEEYPADGQALTATATGRRPIMLRLSASAPCLCGMLIKRGLCQVILAGLDGEIFEEFRYDYESLSGKEELLSILLDGFEKLKKRTTRRITGIGIASVGPLNLKTGTILSPPFFYGIENFPIVSMIEQGTNLPVFLVNDANAGAMAEKIYGSGRNLHNFMYLHIMNGIGAGMILHDNMYNGDSGQSGEIGHTSITFTGPKCACGNVGCLDLYANLDSLWEHKKFLSPFFPDSPLNELEKPYWERIVSLGNQKDPLAVALLENFCSYIAYALVDALNLLNLSHIIVGYDSLTGGGIIESLLQKQIGSLVMSSSYTDTQISYSSFAGAAPLVGAVAVVANQIYTGSLPLDELCDLI